MRLATLAEGPIERLAARLNLVPRPLVETQVAYTLARVVMAATQLGVLEALGRDGATPEQVAERCGTDPGATGKLLFALAGAGYAIHRDGLYAVSPMARTWLHREGSRTLADKMTLQYREWEWMGRTEDYVRTGRPVELHRSLDDAGWGDYQRGMRAIAGAFAPEVVRRLPVPRKATRLLDVGGSHGFLSVALCRRHDGLRAEVLDLPEAVAQAAPILVAEGMGERVVHRPGDALTEDLGSETYDVIIISQLVHHFSAAQNRELADRAARALRPGGVYAILDLFRQPTPGAAGQIGALMEFFFALTSQSGTWSVPEMSGWQRAAGLEPRRTLRLRTAPGAGIVVARKR